MAQGLAHLGGQRVWNAGFGPNEAFRSLAGSEINMKKLTCHVSSLF